MVNQQFPSKDPVVITEPETPNLPVASLDAQAAEIAARTTSSSVLEEILGRAEASRCDHWGINE